MNEPVRQRLHREHERLDAILPRLTGFVGLHRTVGTPPTAHWLALLPFGFRVVVDDGGAAEPVVYDPARHGTVELALVADPDHHPWRPWSVNLLTRPDVTVLSPHVSNAPGVRGLVCWLDGEEFDPDANTLPRALVQVLRILAGEVYALEGFALSEDAKVWFAAHGGELPFARVPDGRCWSPDAPPSERGPQTDPLASTAGDDRPRQLPTSLLGIEFGGDR